MSSGLLFVAAMSAGALGSAHCLGMCGPVVSLLEHGRPARPLVRRLAYNGGRLAGYAVLGGLAAAAGGLLHALPAGTAVLRTVAAVMIVLMGLQLAFSWPLLRALEAAGSRVWQRLLPLTRHVLPADTVPRALAAGILWGALPCGLVYSAVALAATSESVLSGALVMSGFWLGTLPALMLAGGAAGQLARWRRQPSTRRVAGAVLVAAGFVALALPLRHAGHDAKAQGMAEGSHVAHPGHVHER